MFIKLPYTRYKLVEDESIIKDFMYFNHNTIEQVLIDEPELVVFIKGNNNAIFIFLEKERNREYTVNDDRHYVSEKIFNRLIREFKEIVGEKH